MGTDPGSSRDVEMDWRNKNILIIDDEQHMRWLLAALFRHRGATVHLAADGRAGLQAFAELRPDLVILDVLLPGMNGHEVLRIMRQSSLVPVVMLSAISSNDEIVRHIDAGADDYVIKPFDSELLLSRCAAALPGRLSRIQKEATVGKHIVDEGPPAASNGGIVAAH